MKTQCPRDDRIGDQRAATFENSVISYGREMLNLLPYASQSLRLLSLSISPSRLSTPPSFDLACFFYSVLSFFLYFPSAFAFGLLRTLPRVMFKHLLLFLCPLLTPRNQPHSSVTHKILKNNAASAICLTAAFSALLSSRKLERSARQF